MPVLLESLLGPSKLAISHAGQWGTSQIPGVLFSASGRESATGATVTDRSSLSLSAVFAGVRLLSQIVGMLPLNVYKRKSDGGKTDATTHPAHNVLHTSPNAWMTPKQCKQVLEWNRMLGGNAFAEIQWTGGGNVYAIWPLGYWRVQIKWDKEQDQSDFHYIVDGKRRVEKEDMIHVPLVSWDGICGQSFLDYAVESIGLGITVQQAAAYFFSNGGRPDGILKNATATDATQRKKFRESWQEVHGGQGGSGKGKVGVLWGGWEWQDNAFITPEQQQALESRRFLIEEVARWLNIPPHLLRDLTRATFSNIENQGIDFVVYSLSPMLVDYEQEYDRKLLSPPNVYSKHNVNALMRGDSAARANFCRQLWGIGVFSANDVCEFEDMNPIGPEGDLRFVPANMITLENAKANKPPAAGQSNPGGTPAGPNAGPGSDHAGGGNEPVGGLAVRAWASDVFARMLRKEANAANRAATKPDKFLDWLDEFYVGHVDTMTAALSPLVTLGPLVGMDQTKPRKAAESHCKQSHTALLELTGHVSPATLAPSVAQLMNEWEANRPAAQAAEFCGDDNAAT